MENHDDLKMAKKIATTLRKSRFQGKYYLTLCDQPDPRDLCLKTLAYLTSQEIMTLAENVASLRYGCQNKKQFFSVYYCCHFLERIRLEQQLFCEFRKKSIAITQKLYAESRVMISDKVEIRLAELGLTTFEDLMRSREQKPSKGPSLQAPALSPTAAGKLSQSLADIKKLPQSLFAKLKSVFRPKKPSNQPQLQETQQFIVFQKPEKQQKP